MLHLTSLGVLILYSLFGIRAVLGQCTFLLLPYLLQSAKLQPCRSPLVTDVTNVDIWRLAQMWPMIYQMFDSFGGTVPPAKMGCPCSRPKSRSWSVHYLRGPQIHKNRIDTVSTFLTWNGKCVGGVQSVSSYQFHKIYSILSLLGCTSASAWTSKGHFLCGVFWSKNDTSSFSAASWMTSSKSFMASFKSKVFQIVDWTLHGTLSCDSLIHVCLFTLDFWKNGTMEWTGSDSNWNTCHVWLPWFVEMPLVDSCWDLGQEIRIHVNATMVV